MGWWKALAISYSRNSKSTQIVSNLLRCVAIMLKNLSMLSWVYQNMKKPMCASAKTSFDTRQRWSQKVLYFCFCCSCLTANARSSMIQFCYSLPVVLFNCLPTSKPTYRLLFLSEWQAEEPQFARSPLESAERNQFGTKNTVCNLGCYGRNLSPTFHILFEYKLDSLNIACLETGFALVRMWWDRASWD